jgi:hypothetical protein
MCLPEHCFFARIGLIEKNMSKRILSNVHFCGRAMRFDALAQKRLDLTQKVVEASLQCCWSQISFVKVQPVVCDATHLGGVLAHPRKCVGEVRGPMSERDVVNVWHEVSRVPQLEFVLF